MNKYTKNAVTLPKWLCFLHSFVRCTLCIIGAIGYESVGNTNGKENTFSFDDYKNVRNTFVILCIQRICKSFLIGRVL